MSESRGPFPIPMDTTTHQPSSNNIVSQRPPPFSPLERASISPAQYHYFQPPYPSLAGSDEEEADLSDDALLSLQYLHVFSREQLSALEEQHQKMPQELDDLVRKHQAWYRFFLADTLFAIGTDIAATPWQILTSRDGVQSGVKLIQRDTQVSNSVGLSIGAPLALADLAYKTASVSARQEAIKRTLAYALRDSYAEQFQEFKQEAEEEPLKAAGRIVNWGFRHTVSSTHSLLYGAANILAFYEPVEFSLPFVGGVSIPPLLPQLSTGAQIGIGAGLAYSGHRYSSIFFTPDYDQHSQDFLLKGLSDLWNKNPDGEPWLVGELFRGKLSTPLQLGLRGLASTLFTRAYPRFFNIAETAFEKLAGLDPATSAKLAVTTTVLVGWHSFCAEYPKSYRRAMGDHIKIDALLRQSLEKTVSEAADTLIAESIDSMRFSLNLTETNKRKRVLKEQMMQNFVEIQRELLQTEAIQSKSNDFVFQYNPNLKLEMATQALSGLYWGGSTVAPFLLEYVDAPILVNFLCLVSVPTLLTLTCYQAEKERTINHLVRKKIDPELKAEGSRSEASSTPVDALIIASHVSRALSVLGSGKRTFGDGNRAAMSTTVFLLMQNFMEVLHLTYKKAQTAIASWPCSSKPKSNGPTSTRSTFFYPDSPQTLEAKKASTVNSSAKTSSWWQPSQR